MRTKGSEEDSHTQNRQTVHEANKSCKIEMFTEPCDFSLVMLSGPSKEYERNILA